MKGLFWFIAFLFFCHISPCIGATYYVDTAGNDKANGALATPWKTINHAMSTAAPGDTILIKGGVYREHVKVTTGAGGSAGNPITVKAYDANEVILDGSVVISGWTVDTGQIYKTTPGTTVDAVVVDYVPLKPAVTQTNSAAGYTDTTTRAEVTISEGQFYQDNSTGILYVWVPGGGSPTSHTMGIIRVAPDTSNQYDGIYLWDAGYFNFQDLTIRFYGARGIEALGASSNITLDRVKIKFNRHTGVQLKIPYVTVTDSEVSWNFLWNWPRGKFNGGTQGGGWGGGLGVGDHGTVTGCTIYKNGGEGLITYMNAGNTVFKGNIIYDNWSMNLYIDTAPYVIAENNFIYCSNYDMADAANNGFPTDQTVWKGLFPIGISTADEYYGGPHEFYMHDVIIRNNIVVNCRRGYNHFAQYVGSGMIDVTIANNTIIVPDFQAPGAITPSSGDNFIGIILQNPFGANTGNVIKNNIVVSRNSANYALYSENSDTDSFAPYTMSNNLWYTVESTTPIHWGSSYGAAYDRTLAQWQALSGTAHGQGDISADPLFTGGSDPFTASYYTLSSRSPALGAGATLQGFSTDFYSNARPAAWAIGAVEKLSTAPFIKSMIIINR